MKTKGILIVSLLLLLFPTNSISNTPLNSELTDSKLNTETSYSSMALSIPRIRLLLFDKPTFDSGSSSADDLLRINFVSGGNNAVDFDDAPKFSNPDENIARNVNGTPISIEERDLPQINEVLPLYSFGYATTDYVFVLTVLNMQFYNVFLYDNFTNTSYLLDKNAQTIINFSVDSNVSGSTSINRFEFRFNSTECDPTLSGNLDSDSDNISDFCDLDDDNDGILDLTEIPSEPSADRDGDGVPVFLDDNDSDENIGDVNTAIEQGYDTDGDGILDNLALDSDNDGCSDANEYYEMANADGNADGNDDNRYGNSSSLMVNGFGLVNDADYDGTSTGLSNSKDINITEGCLYLQIADGNWNDIANWQDGVIPALDNNATIGNGIQSTITQNQTVRSLTLVQGTSSTTSVNINDTFTLSVKGNLENNGEFSGAGELLLDGAANQDISGSGDYENLRINNLNGVDVLNINLNDPTEINGVLYLDSGIFATSNNVLFPCFFEEPTTGNFANRKAGQIGPIGASATISGDVRVEQCYPGRRAYRYVSASTTTTTTSIHDNWQENATAYNNIPVASTTQDDGIPFGFGTHITGLGSLPAHSTTDPNTADQTNGLDWQPSGNPSMFEFNEAIQDFDPVLVTEPTTLTAGKVYNMIIRGSRDVDLTTNASPTSNTKLRSTGTAIKGDYTISPNVSADQYILVGNPFHAIVNMNVVYNNNTGFSRFMTAFDPTLGGFPDSNPTSALTPGRGAFVSIDMEDVTPGNANEFGQMRHYLQAYQGVFMQATVNNPTLTFSETDKAVEQPQADVFSTTTDRVAITLYDQQSYSANNTADDKVIIKFGQNKNSGIDYDDALKFFNPDENLGRLEGSSLLSIEERQMPEIGEVLELYTTNYRATNYIFIAKVDGLFNNTVSLYDNYTNTETVLHSDISTAISFTVDPTNPLSEATDRFQLRFETTTLGTNEFELQGVSVYPNPASYILNIELGGNPGRFESLQLFDITGKLIISKSLGNQLMEVQLDVNRFNSGVYVLKLTSGSEQISKKIILK